MNILDSYMSEDRGIRLCEYRQESSIKYHKGTTKKDDGWNKIKTKYQVLSSAFVMKKFDFYQIILNNLFVACHHVIFSSSKVIHNM